MDRRVKRTRKRLREALIEILHKKEVYEITVSELAEKADINRGTFYTHYRHAADLLLSLKDEFFDEISQCFNCNTTRDILEKLYETVERNSDIVEVLMKELYYKKFVKDMRNRLSDGCRNVWHIDERNQKYVTDHIYDYISGGMCSLILEWAEDENSRSAIEMAIITEIFIMNSIKNLQ